MASIYHPLDQATNEIRLLTVLPAPSTRDELNCDLRAVALDHRPRFEAISYAWSDISQRQSLVLNGQSCSVSQNLADALCHFRNRETPILLWADQLCINQHDPEERSQQVCLMAQIYRQALRVRIWLGKAGPQNEKLMEILSGKVDITDDAILSSSRGRVDAMSFSLLTILLNRPWWTRLWVLQEVVLAREAHLYCGPQNVNLLDVLLTSQKLDAVNNSVTRTSSPESTLERTQFIRTLHRRMEIFSFLKDLQEEAELAEEHRETQATQASQFAQATQATQPLLFEGEASDDDLTYGYFLRILLRCRSHFASDPRDKVYALLGLLPERIVSEISPNYSQSAESVFAHTTRLILRHTQSIFILHFAVGFASRAGGPSWAATFASFRGSTEEAQFRLRMQVLELFDISIGTEPSLSLLNNDLLLLRGLRLDAVSYKTEGIPFGRPTSVDSLVSTLTEWSAQIRHALSTLGLLADCIEWNETGPARFFKEAFICAVVGGTIPIEGSSFVRLLESSDFDPSYSQSFNQFFDSALPDLLYQENVREDSLSNHLIKHLHGKCIFITEKGLIGVGPAAVRLGDEIFILAGGKLPFILGPTSFREDHYVLVGDAYVHGLMQGLPELNRFFNELRSAAGQELVPQRNESSSQKVDNWQDVYIGG